MQYGNQASIDIRYSTAALLMRISPLHERGTLSGITASKTLFEGVKSDDPQHSDTNHESGNDEDENMETEDE
jgi:hypothetical protein